MRRYLVVVATFLFTGSSPGACKWHILPDGTADGPKIHARIDLSTDFGGLHSSMTLYSSLVRSLRSR